MSKRTLLKAVSCVLSFVMLLSSLPLMFAFSAAAKDVAQADIESAVNENSGFNPYDISIDPDSSEYPLVEGYKTIVFDARDWTQAYAYCWQKGTGDALAEWPGTPMKKVTDDNGYGMKRYVAYIPPEYDMYIINNGNVGAGNKTVDLEISENIGIYMDGTDASGNCTVGYWEPNFYYYEFSTDAATTQAVKPTQTAPPSCEIIVYYENTEDWSQVYCHVWSDSGATTTWPGILMEYVGNNIFKADIGNEYTSVVFHDGSTDADCMSPDLYIPGDNMLYSNGCWYEYVESPTDTTENPDPTEIIVEVDSKVVTWNDGSYNYHSFEADVTGGTAPYTYEFILDGFDFTEDSCVNKASVCIGENGEYSLVVVVTDAFGYVGTAEMIVDVDVHEEETIPDDDTYTLYFRNHNNWSDVHAYSWCDNEEVSQPLGLWPGTKCKYINDDIWAIEVTDNFDYIIFNDARNQTNILSNPGGFNIARWISTDGNDSEYEWEFPVITDFTETTEATEPPKEDIKLYFDNSESYDQVFAYVWGGESDEYGYISQWPGVLCEDENNGTWSVMVPADCEYVLFHNGYSVQTNDLKNPGETKIAKVVEVANGMDIYDWFDLDDFTTVVTDPQETTPAPEASEPIVTTAAVTNIVTDPQETTTIVLTTVAIETQETTPPSINGVWGDANLDNKVSVFDTTIIQKWLARCVEFEEIQEKLSDADGNGVVNIKDAVMIQKYLALVIGDRVIVPEFSGATEDGVNIDGENYKVEVGDTLTYELCIKAPKYIENIQAYVAFDSSKLRLLEDEYEVRFPNMTGVVSNVVDGLVVFNASEISTGFDYLDGEVAVYLEFEVLDSSATEIVAVIENMAEYFGDVYFEDGEQKNDYVKVTHEFRSGYKATEPIEPETTLPAETKPDYEGETGDVNLDGKINIFDVTLIQKFLAKSADFSDEVLYKADYNNDGKIDIKDGTAIQKYLALITGDREIVPEFSGTTEDGVNIDGENYKVEVGDTVTYEFCIETPEKIENIQAYVAFDSSKLRLLDEDNSTRFGNMMGVVSNVVDGLVVFNASDIYSGIDITGGKAVVSLKFEVLDSSATEIVAIIENMAEFFGSVYIKDGEQKNDEVKFYHTVDIDSKPTEPTTTEPATTEATEEITTTIPTEPSTTVPVTTAPSEPEFEIGDVNLDGKINIKDVTSIQKYLAKMLDFSEDIMLLADFNGDSVINIKDATTIQKKIANLI